MFVRKKNEEQTQNLWYVIYWIKLKNKTVMDFIYSSTDPKFFLKSHVITSRAYHLLKNLIKFWPSK